MKEEWNNVIEDRLSPLVMEMKKEWQTNACEILQKAVSTTEKDDELIPLVQLFLEEMMQQLASPSTSSSGNKKNYTKKQEWRQLQRQAKKLLLLPSSSSSQSVDGTIFTIGLVLGTLSLFPSNLNSSSKAIASAIAATTSTTTTSSSSMLDSDEQMSKHMIQIFLQHYIHNFKEVNLSVLVYLVQAMNVSKRAMKNDKTLNTLTAQALQVATASNNNNNDDDENNKEDWMAALKLACSISPCPKIISLKECIHLAIVPYKLWHVAEQLCHEYDPPPVAEVKSTEEDDDSSSITTTTTTPTTIIIEEAVEFLVNLAWQRDQYRMADQISTALHKRKGRASIQLLAKARYYHARSTIYNMIQKRQYPLIERQVDRVDRVVSSVRVVVTTTTTTTNHNNGTNDDDQPNNHHHEYNTYSHDIRSYALEKLKEEGEIESLIRYSKLWGYPTSYTEEEYQQLYENAQEKKRSTYLQWNELFGQRGELSSLPPQLISDVSELWNKKDFFIPTINNRHYGFDAEWDDDCRSGVAILQIATIHQVLLLDMIALTSTKEGIDALQQTVGTLFSSSNSSSSSSSSSSSRTLIGFSCKEDLQRLRQQISITRSNQQDNNKCHNIVDLKVLIGKEKPSLKDLGLSRVCRHFLGKPLDKSEQCSNWSSNRPLSTSQRIYAALDAYVCVAIYQQLQQKQSSSSSSNPNKKPKKMN